LELIGTERRLAVLSTDMQLAMSEIRKIEKEKEQRGEIIDHLEKLREQQLKEATELVDKVSNRGKLPTQIFLYITYFLDISEQHV